MSALPPPPTTPPAPRAAAALPWRVAPPLVSTALIYIGAGVLGTLLPLRFSALGLSPGLIGLLATAEALGFLIGCLNAHRIIAPVGLERAYAAFAGTKAVAILAMHFATGVPFLAVIRFLIGLNAAGLAVIVESWLNALVSNEQRGRVLTLYVLVVGLFYGGGQLMGESLNVRGPEMLFIAGMATTLALVPMAGIEVRAPSLPHKVELRILKAFSTSPVSVLACMLNGLILTAFTTAGPLFGEQVGFDQRQIIVLMACVSLGGLFLQWPIGYFSDKIDRLYALIGLGAGTLAVAVALAAVDRHTPFLLLALLFCGVRRPRREPVRGRRRACERPRGVGRLRRAVVDAAVRLGARRRDRPDRRVAGDGADAAERVLRLRGGADARVHAVRGLAPHAPQGGAAARDARGVPDLPADLARDLRVAAVPQGVGRREPNAAGSAGGARADLRPYGCGAPGSGGAAAAFALR